MMKTITPDIRNALFKLRNNFKSEREMAKYIGTTHSTLRRWLDIDKSKNTVKMNLTLWRELKPKIQDFLPENYYDASDIFDKYSLEHDFDRMNRIFSEASTLDRLKIIKKMIDITILEMEEKEKNS